MVLQLRQMMQEVLVTAVQGVLLQQGQEEPVVLLRRLRPHAVAVVAEGNLFDAPLAVIGFSRFERD